MPATRGKRPGTTGNEGTDEGAATSRVFGDPAPKALTPLGLLIVALSEAKALSLTAVADAAKLDPKTLHNLLRGKHGPKKLTLLSISKVLEAPIEWLTTPALGLQALSLSQSPSRLALSSRDTPDDSSSAAVQPLPSTPALSQRSSDVAIITVLPEYELRAVLHRFGIEPHAPEHERRGSLRLWHTSLNSRRHGQLNIAITSIGPSGNADASSVTTSAIEHLHPHLAVLVGIAAGREGSVQLGDVVVAEQVLAYEFEKRTPDGTLPRPRHKALHQTVRDDLAFFTPSAPALYEDIQRECAGLDADELPPIDVAPSGTAIRYPATIASGEAVLADGSLEALSQRFGDDRLIAGEMESAGFCIAAERARTPWLSIRGISDFGTPQSKDGRAKDRFHHFASISAACYAYHFLRDAYSAIGHATPQLLPLPSEGERRPARAPLSPYSLISFRSEAIPADQIPIRQRLEEVRQRFFFLGVSAKILWDSQLFDMIADGRYADCTFRFMLLDPAGTALERKMDNEQSTAAIARLDIKSFLLRLTNAKRGRHSHVSARYYDIFIPFWVMLCDDILYLQSFPAGTIGRNSPLLILRPDSPEGRGFFDPAIGFLEELWSHFSRDAMEGLVDD